MRQTFSSGSPFEAEIAFSRAVRLGDKIAIAGTAPIDALGHTVGAGDVYAQTQRCLAVILAALHQAGADATHVIRTRVLLTDVSRWREAARAHKEVFAGINPVTTFVQVVGFINPDWMVEVEADAAFSHLGAGSLAASVS